VKAKKATPKAAAPKVKEPAKKPAAKAQVKPAPPVSRVPGRPTGYSDEVADQICEQIASGLSLRKICLLDGMPGFRTVFDWLSRPELESFRSKYTRAREVQADYYAEQTVDIADEEEVTTKRNGEDVEVVFDAVAVARNRLRMDARKWYAAKLAPKKYGDRTETVHSGAIGVTGILESLDGESTGLPR
jgi:hypothetical protein